MRLFDNAKVSLTITGLLLAVLARPVNAGGVPNATYRIDLSDGGSYTAPGSYAASSTTDCTYYCAFEDASIVVPPGPGFDPSLSIDGNAQIGPNAPLGQSASATADASVDYYFEVSGPGPAVVPVDMTFSATAEAGVSIATFKFRGVSGGQPVDYEYDCPASCSLTNFPFMVSANTPSPISMSLFGSVDVSNEPDIISNLSFSATLDPTITIDPIFLESHPGYSLVFSQNPSTPAPEPGTWSLMLIGIFGVAMRMRARRPAVTFVAG
jgi:hypothetical protein